MSPAFVWANDVTSDACGVCAASPSSSQAYAAQPLLSELMSGERLDIEVLCTANQLIAPTRRSSRSTRSSVISGSTASGKWSRSSIGLQANAVGLRLVLALVRWPRVTVTAAGRTSSWARTTESTTPETSCSNVRGWNPAVVML